MTRHTYRRLTQQKLNEMEKERERMREHERLIDQARLDKQQFELEREWQVMCARYTTLPNGTAAL